MHGIYQIEEGLLQKNLDVNVAFEFLDAREAIGEFVSHPLGFLRLALGVGKTGPMYLHYWPDTLAFMEDKNLRAHRHSVSVYSCVLLGEIVDTRFSWADNSRGFYELLEQNLDRPRAGLTPTGRRGDLLKVATKKIVAGGCYSVSYEYFHVSNWRMKGDAATIAIFSGRKQQTPMVAKGSSCEKAAEAAETLYESSNVGLEATQLIIDRILIEANNYA